MELDCASITGYCGQAAVRRHLCMSSKLEDNVEKDNRMQKQQGITLIGMLMTVASVIVLAVLLMRVLPVYIQNYEVHSSIKALKELDASNFSSDPMSNVAVLKDKLMKQFNINGITDVKEEHITIIPKVPGVYTVSVKYIVVKSLVANISMLFDFNESEEVSVGPK
jgi:hypothetical protein